MSGQSVRRDSPWVLAISGAIAFALIASACTNSGRAEPSTTTSSSAPSRPAADIPRPPPPAPIAVVLRGPASTAEALVGQPTLVGGAVLAEDPVVRLELWHQSGLVEVIEYDDPARELRDAWSWVPTETGLHSLVLRAFDSSGRSATSFPLWVRASDPATPETVSRKSSPRQETATLSSLGRMIDVALAPTPSIAVDAATCLATVTISAVQDATGVAVYAASFGSAGFVPMDLVPGSGGTATIPLAATPLLVYAEAYDAANTNPGPPQIVLPPNPCVQTGWNGELGFENGLLSNPKGADRAYLYISEDGGEAWRRVPSLDQSFVFEAQGGGFDFGGLIPPPAPGAEVLMEAWGWVAGSLTPLGRGSWTSPTAGSPSSPGSSENLVAAPYNGPLVPDSALDWKLGNQVINNQPVGPAVLVRSGTICTYPPPPPAAVTTTTVPVSVAGGATTSSTSPPVTTPAIGVLPDSCTNAPFGNYSKTFRWEPIPGALDHGVLQVSTQPIPQDPVLNFPGLIYTAKVDKPSGGSVDFEVPLAEIINPPASPLTLNDWESVSFETVATIGAAAATSGNGFKRIKTPAAFGSPPHTTLYLRVVPMSGSQQPLVGKSNEVVINVDSQAPPPSPPPNVQPPSMSVEVRMTPPHLPNPQYQRCVRVIENPFGAKNPSPSTTPEWLADHPQTTYFFMDSWYSWAENAAFLDLETAELKLGLIPGATVCAVQLSPPSKDAWDYIVDAITFIGWVWDMYILVWDKMKAWAVDVLAVVSGCDLLAKQGASAVGKSEADAESFCKGLAKTAINYTLMYFGVPPTMPKFKDLVEMGKGELTDVLVKLAADAGFLDCNVAQSVCEEVAKKLLDKLLDDLQVAATEAATQAATAGSQWVLAIHPAIYVIPEPAGTMSPATFTIKITRSPDPNAPPPPSSCTYTGHVWGQKAHYEWQNYFKGTWQTGPVSGWVVHAENVTIDLAGIKPGESRTATLVLDQIAKWYPEGQNPQLPNVPYWSIKPQTWIFLAAVPTGGDPKTELITSISSTGCGSANQVHTQDSKPTEPWEIPLP